jgi:hypothetical protein
LFPCSKPIEAWSSRVVARIQRIFDHGTDLFDEKGIRDL